MGERSAGDGRVDLSVGRRPDPNRANYDKTGLNGTSAVGCFPGGASPTVAKTLSGNVLEWTRSLWGKDLDKPTLFTPTICPTGGGSPPSDNVLRVLRAARSAAMRGTRAAPTASPSIPTTATSTSVFGWWRPHWFSLIDENSDL